MNAPVIAADEPRRARELMTASVPEFAEREWRGSGPAALHVHRSDPEGWEVLEGTLRFRFPDRTVDVSQGSSVFVPAGVPHTYEAIAARYRILLTPRIEALISALQRAPNRSGDREIYRTYDSELLED